MSAISYRIRSRSRLRGLGVYRDSYVRPTPVVKSYARPEPVVHLEPAPVPAPVVRKTYVEHAPLPILPRRPIPTVRNIEVPVEKHYEYVAPAPAPAPVAVHETYVEPAPAPAPVAVHRTYVEPEPAYVAEPAYAVSEPAPLPGKFHGPNSVFFPVQGIYFFPRFLTRTILMCE